MPASPPSTAHRILATLKAAGFVQCDEARGGYLIGVKAFKIGSAFLRNRKLVDVGRGVMRDLMAASGETTNLGIENDGYVVFVSQLESHHAIRAFHRPGARGPMHASSLGKAILAWLPEAEVTKLLHRVGLPRLTDRTIVDPQALLADLAADPAARLGHRRSGAGRRHALRRRTGVQRAWRGDRGVVRLRTYRADDATSAWASWGRWSSAPRRS